MAAKRTDARSTGGKPPDDEFANFVPRSRKCPIALTTAAKHDLAELKMCSGSAFVLLRLFKEQLHQKEELTVLVEDVYELQAEERKLLRSTRPVRDPLNLQPLCATGPPTEAANERHVK